MKPCYINSVGCVSTQNTIDTSQFLNDVITHNANVIEIVKPNYKEYMQGASARRMAKGVKMGVVASTLALKEANVNTIDAIITGTGLGCAIDSEKFVSAIIDNDEQFLTPTSFIQSTHNTVGGQVALGLQCKAYNFTYVNGAVSFESCLVDAQLMLSENNASNILVGGIDEIGAHTIKIHKLINHIKTEETISSDDVLNSNTKGAVFGEGASFFVLSNQQQESTYAKLVDIEMLMSISKENITKKISEFLKRNELTVDDIDAIVLGNNGDIEFDAFYKELQNDTFKNTTQIAYKHLSGEYYTASAFGFWLAAKVLKEQIIPEEVLIHKTTSNSFKNILLYNQYRGKDHSFTLLQKC